jgi:IS4 transposase
MFTTYLGGRSAAQDSGMDQACEFDVGDVARGAVDAFKVPDGFRTVVIRSVT